jgi:alpha-tubulin suppressor-like RCC1 family protein
VVRWITGSFAFAVAIACGTSDANLPVYPTLDEQGADGFVTVSTGLDHSCALTASGSAYCWGSDSDQQLGVSPSFVCDSVNHIGCSLFARQIVGAPPFRTISAGARHTCAVALDLTAYCWGSNDDGALGSAGPGAPFPRAVGGSQSFATISAGSTHTCAVATDGTAYCWGRNDRGQLGTNDTTARALPTAVSTTAHFLDVSAGNARTCGRSIDGNVLCWGAIWVYRQAGLEFTRAQLVPQAVPGASTLAALSVGAFTTCGIAGNVAVCWEANPHGEMGNGTTDGSTIPLVVTGGLSFVSIAAGIIQTCGVTSDGGAYCWGNDSFGQLGVSPSSLGTGCALQQLPCSLVPLRIPVWRAFRTISTGLGNHVCGVTARTNVYCWGLGNLGQLGFGKSIVATSQQLRVIMASP